MSSSLSADDLLTDVAWLHRLALRLAGDPDDADDLVQEARIAAWRRRPDRARSLRPWLAKVVRDAARMRTRSGARRAAREEAVARGGDLDNVGEGDVGVGAEALLDRVHLYRVLVDTVLELDEPYRTTVLRRFVDGWSAEEIGRAMGVPSGTVRWRVHEALERLRAAMDRGAGGRGAWLPMLAAGDGGPLGCGPVSPHTRPALPKVVAGGGLALVALIGLVVWSAWGSSAGDPALHRDHGASERPGRAPATVVGGGRGVHGGESVAAPSATPNWLVPAPGDVAPATIDGVVVDASGAPIAGATVALQTWASATNGFDEVHVVTADDGAFALAPRLAGRYFVIATAPGHATAAHSLDPRQSDVARRVLTLVLPGCDARLEGVITDAAGTPVPGATVRHIVHAGILPAGPFGPLTVADGHGRYVLCVARGEVRVSVAADGYETVEAALPVGGRNTLDLVLAPASTVNGRVVDDAGEAVAGVQVVLWPDGRGARSPGVVTGISTADGTFQIDGVAGGRYEVTTWGADTVSPRPGIMLTVAPGALVGPIDVAVTRGVEVHGVVSAGSEPVAGASVQVTAVGVGPSRATVAAVTHSDGHFVVRGAPPGPCHVVVANYTVDIPTSLEVTGPIAGLTVAVHRLPTIRGVVRRGGAPVANAEVAYRARGSNTYPRHLLADADGTFEIHVAPGDHELSAVAPAIGAAVSAPVVVTVGERSLDGITLDLMAGAAIAGTVIDAHGAPVEGVEIVAASEDGDAGSATSDVDGTFRIDQLAGGRAYALSARAYPGAASALALSRDDSGPLAPIVLDDGATDVTGVRVEVTAATRRLAGRVVDGAGEPAPDVWVRAGAPDDGGTLTIWPAWPVARTDENGRFTLVVRGTGRVRVSASRGDGALGDATVAGAAEDDIAISLSSPR